MFCKKFKFILKYLNEEDMEGQILTVSRGPFVKEGFFFSAFSRAPLSCDLCKATRLRTGRPTGECPQASTPSPAKCVCVKLHNRIPSGFVCFLWQCWKQNWEASFLRKMESYHLGVFTEKLSLLILFWRHTQKIQNI